MKTKRHSLKTGSVSIVLILAIGLMMVTGPMPVMADGSFDPTAVTDQTPTAPLANPDPTANEPRYISGFGGDDAFTVFYEDRDDGSTIYYNTTTTGPLGFAATSTATNIADTHFVVKDWPIIVGTTTYAYRAWGAVGNNMDHHFYVSNDLTNWTLVSTFTIPNASGFTDAHGWVYYGFHDVIELNGTYYAFAESNQSQTMIVRSADGDDVWEAFDSVGGRPGDGPLELPAGVTYGWTPSGSFVDLGHDRGYGKVYADPGDSHFYLAINTAAQASLPPADLEAAFINPANWTWHDGTTGPAANPILSETAEHDLRECWVVPNTDPDADWVIVYDADFGAADGDKALGYATLTPPLPPPSVVYVDDDWVGTSPGTDPDGAGPAISFGYDAFATIQEGIDAVVAGGTVYVAAGTYNESIVLEAGFDKDDLTISGDASDRPVVTGGVRLLQTAQLDGLTFENLTIRGVATGGNSVFDMDNAGVVNDFVMDNCVIDGEDVSGRTGFIGQNLGQSFSMTNNEFKDILGWAVMDIDSGSGDGGNSQPFTTVTFADNNVHDNNGSVALRGNPSTRTTVVDVYGNTFGNIGGNNGEAGEQWAALEVNHAVTVNIHDNTFDGVAEGVWGEGQALQLWDIDTVDIHANDVTNNFQGIFIFGGSAGGTYGGPYVVPDGRIYDNNIAGNAAYGIDVDPAATGGPLDARGNWWGAADGPSGAGPGSGDGVSANVAYCPWLDGAYPGGALTSNSGVAINLDTGEAFCSIQAAIDDADTLDGHTIAVSAWTYDESVVIDKSLHVQGAGAASTSIAPASGPAVLVRADDVTVEAFTLTGSNTWALDMDGGSGTTFPAGGVDNTLVQDCVFSGSHLEGVFVGNGAAVSNLTVTGCAFDDNLNGIGVSGAATTVDGLTIDTCTSANNTNHGLYLNGATVTDLLIQDSDFTDNTNEGIHVTGASVDPFTMQGGTIEGNASGLVVQGGATLGLLTLDGVTVQNNGESGVMLGGGASATALLLQNNHFQGNAWEELDLSGGWFGAFSVSGDTTITGNVFGGGPWVAIYVGDQASFGATPVIYNNDLSSYSVSVYNTSAALVDASGNWWGSNVAATVRARANGGTNVDYTPWLDSGTNNAAGIGFDGDFSVLWVDDDSLQAGATGRVQEGVNLVSGSTVNVLAGTYGENVVIDKDNLVVQSVPTHAATLDGSAQPNDYYGNKGFWIQGDRHDVTIDGFEITGYPEGPEDGAGIFGGSTASGPNYPGTVRDIVLRNNVIHGNGNDGIQIDKADDGEHTGIVIDGNQIYDHQNDVDMSAGIKMYDASGGLITGNTLHHNERGILFYEDVLSTTIEHNHVYSTTSTVNGEGIKLDDGSCFNVVRYNYVYDNPDDGIRLDDDSNDNEIAHNTVYNNAGSGIFIEDDSINNVVRDNIVALSGKYGIEEESTTGPYNTEFSNLFHANALGDFDVDTVSEGADIFADPMFVLPVRPTFTPSCDPLSPAESTASDTDGGGRPLDRGATQVDCTCLTIVKWAPEAKPDHEFGFTGDLGDFVLLAGGSFHAGELDPGSYTVAENPSSFPDKYWALLSVTCVDGQGQPVAVDVDLFAYSATVLLQSGQHVTCTFLNERANVEEDGYQYYLPLVLK